LVRKESMFNTSAEEANQILKTIQFMHKYELDDPNLLVIEDFMEEVHYSDGDEEQVLREPHELLDQLFPLGIDYIAIPEEVYEQMSTSCLIYMHAAFYIPGWERIKDLMDDHLWFSIYRECFQRSVMMKLNPGPGEVRPTPNFPLHKQVQKQNHLFPPNPIHLSEPVSIK
jgi:hypothetical protein